MNNNIILVEKERIEASVRAAVDTWVKDNPDLEVHTIRVDGRFNYVTKKLEYGIYADVREKGQIFLGMCN